MEIKKIQLNSDWVNISFQNTANCVAIFFNRDIAIIGAHWGETTLKPSFSPMVLDLKYAFQNLPFKVKGSWEITVIWSSNNLKFPTSASWWWISFSVRVFEDSDYLYNVDWVANSWTCTRTSRTDFSITRSSLQTTALPSNVSGVSSLVYT